MNWNLNTYSGVVYENKLWFSNKDFNGLFRQDILNGKIEFVQLFPDESVDICHAHKEVIRVGKRLFFIPAYANNIHVYNIETEGFTTIPIEKKSDVYCAGAVLLRDNIYIFTYSGELFILNVSSLRIVDDEEFARNCKANSSGSEEFVLCRVSEYNNTVYFAFYGKNIIGSYNLESYSFSTYHTGVEDLFMCYVHDDKCWITTKGTDEIFRFDLNNGESRLIYSKSGIKSEKVIYNRIFSYNGSTWFIPAYSGKAISISDSGEYTIYDDFEILKSDVVNFFGGVEVGDELWLLPFSHNDIFMINGRGFISTGFSFEFNDEKSKALIMSKYWGNSSVIRENDGADLKDYLSFVKWC